ncbi:MAG: N-acetylglucosamine-6-phosphate deacetylase [Candidatus Omnitrophica bacterium]|nr:N-acetylglucosamine-6-phosphate deacetylase [Candidatus Omnitrophota bacterium]
MIYNARLVRETRIDFPAWVLSSGGIIRAMGTGTRYPAAVMCRIDARGCFVGPGCIDLHVHGRRTRLSAALPATGTTAFVRSFFTAPAAELAERLRAERSAEDNGARCLGFHLEGPFLNAAMAGAQPSAAIRKPSVSLMRRLLAEGAGLVRMVTVSGDEPAALPLIRFLRRQGIIAAIGHTTASFEQARRAIESGAGHATHIFNRMPAISARQPGAAAAFLNDPRATLELIADGRHVHPALLALAGRLKAADTIILVSDSVRYADVPGARARAGLWYLADGTIAGSGLCLLRAVKNMVQFCNIPLYRALPMASLNPARRLGCAQRTGSLAVGKDADIIVFDAQYRVELTMVTGKIVYQRKKR